MARVIHCMYIWIYCVLLCSEWLPSLTPFIYRQAHKFVVFSLFVYCFYWIILYVFICCFHKIFFFLYCGGVPVSQCLLIQKLPNLTCISAGFERLHMHFDISWKTWLYWLAQEKLFSHRVQFQVIKNYEKHQFYQRKWQSKLPIW